MLSSNSTGTTSTSAATILRSWRFTASDAVSTAPHSSSVRGPIWGHSQRYGRNSISRHTIYHINNGRDSGRLRGSSVGPPGPGALGGRRGALERPRGSERSLGDVRYATGDGARYRDAESSVRGRWGPMGARSPTGIRAGRRSGYNLRPRDAIRSTHQDLQGNWGLDLRATSVSATRCHRRGRPPLRLNDEPYIAI